MELPESRLIKLYTLLLSKGGCPEPTNMACRLVDRLKEEMEIADTELRIDATDTPVDFDENILKRWDTSRPKRAGVEPIRPKAGAPAPQEKRLVIGPDDPEFAAASAMTETGRRATLASRSVRLSRVASPVSGTNSPEIKYWEYQDIIREVNEHLPHEIWFTPKGTDSSIKAVMDVRAMIGLGFVRVEFKNPGVGEDGPKKDMSVIGLTATHDLRLTDQNLDFDGAMKNIVTQLEGLYAPKQLHGAVELPPPSMRSWKDAPMRDSVEYHDLEGNRDIVADPRGSVLDSVIQDNRSVGERGVKR